MPHYDRNASPAAEQNDLATSANIGEETAVENAAAALREVEVEAVKEEPVSESTKMDRLDSMTIDELREIARDLSIPDRGTIIDQDELIAEIRKRL